MVHVKNRKIENRSAHWFRLTYLNKTMGKMCGRKNSKTEIADEILLLSLNAQYVLLLLEAFLFWPGIYQRKMKWPATVTQFCQLQQRCPLKF